jgi:hypothetical protein
VFRVVDDIERVDECQSMLLKILDEKFTVTKDAVIGFQGGNIESVVHYSPEYDVWFAWRDDGDKYWNPFGVGGNSEKKKALHITVEINIPNLRNRRVMGVFIEDDEGNIYLGHRKRLNSSENKIELNDKFDKMYKEKEIDVVDGDRTVNVICIGNISDWNFFDNLIKFVWNVHDLKNKMKPKSKINRPEFLKESEHISFYNHSGLVEPKANHGNIVNRLAEILNERGLICHNNKSIDLMVLEKNAYRKVSHIFEVKSDFDTQSVYTAIGQLFYHSTNYGIDARKIIVLPKGLKDDTETTLKKLGVAVLLYIIDGSNVIFYGLDEVL